MATDTTYEVRSRRQVPLFETSIGTITGKVVCEAPVHAGEHAVCVKLASGFTAWGFANEPEVAEARAVAAALELAA